LWDMYDKAYIRNKNYKFYRVMKYTFCDAVAGLFAQSYMQYEVGGDKGHIS